MCYCQPENPAPFCGLPACKSPAELAATPNLAAWNAVAEHATGPIDVGQLDALVAAYKEARDDYDAKKKISNEAHTKSEGLKAQVLAALKAAKKSKYHVDGIGTVYQTQKFQVTMPKGLTEKQQLFRFLQERKIHLEFLTVNHQTLNSLFNEERDKDPAFKLPGVADPVLEEGLSFRK